MTNFNKTNLKGLRKDIAKALAEVEKKHGVSLSIGSMSYGLDKFTARLTAYATGEGNERTSAGQIEWNKNCGRYGFSKSDFGGCVILTNGEEATFSGINTRARKYPVQVEGANGKNYKLSADMADLYKQRAIKAGIF